MYRGLFNEKIELIIKGMRRKSYSKHMGNVPNSLPYALPLSHWHHAVIRLTTIHFRLTKRRPMLISHTCPKCGIWELSQPRDWLSLSMNGRYSGIRSMPVLPKARQAGHTKILKTRFGCYMILCGLNLPDWHCPNHGASLMCCSSKKRLINIAKTQNWHKR